MVKEGGERRKRDVLHGGKCVHDVRRCGGQVEKVSCGTGVRSEHKHGAGGRTLYARCNIAVARGWLEV